MAHRVPAAQITSDDQNEGNVFTCFSASRKSRDIDKAIKSSANTGDSGHPDLMIRFCIERGAGNFIAEIKLRNINKE